MNLTRENYFSIESRKEFFSVSQFKDFAGTLARAGCEAMAMAKINGEWEEEKLSDALLVGSYIDAHFSGMLGTFRAQHPEILTKLGELKSPYVKAEEVIQRVERDSYFMKFMSGEKQTIFTAKLFGVPWKCMVDSYIPDLFIVDFKAMKSLSESFWTKDFGKLTFVHAWGYDLQAAVYQEIVRTNTGRRLPFYLAAASKEKQPDIEIIGFTQEDLDSSFDHIWKKIERIKSVKFGEVPPARCEICDYCRFTKVLKKPIHYSELIGRFT